MKWRTPCLGRGVPLPEPTMDGKAARSERTAGAMWLMEAAKWDGKAATAAPIGRRDEADRTQREKGSTNNLWAARKSTPRMGLETAAKMKEQRKTDEPKQRRFVTEPQDGIGLPSAPARAGPEGGAEDLWGKTETAAPVSTKNFC